MSLPSTRSLFARVSPPLLALVFVAVLAELGVLTSLDRAWHDGLQRHFSAHADLPEETAFVLVDEQSLDALGSETYAMRWPWPRKAFAGLFAALHRAGAKAIVADFIFLENSDAAEQDFLLGTVAAGQPKTVLGSVQNDLPIFWSKDFRQAHASLFSTRPRWGSVQSHPDDDGVIRNYSWPGSLAQAALPVSASSAIPKHMRLRWRGSLEQLRQRGIPILPAAPFVAAGLELLGPALEQAPDLEPHALAEAIDRQPAPAGEIFNRVRGKVVFVGANAAGTFDDVATPLHAPEPGVITQWTAYANAQDRGFLDDAPRGVVVLTLVVMVGMIAWAGRHGVGLVAPALVASVALLLALGLSIVAFLQGVWVGPAAPAIGAAVAFSAVAVASFRLERARKREIQGWFGAYVSPAVVKKLIADPEALQLGGERREVTVFFSDLVGFTALAESMPAENLVKVINLCLEELSSVIFDRGGYVDKYIGDAIMAVFGNPEDLPDHASAACLAALECGRRLEALNQTLQREHGVQLKIRIGLNTGEAVVGNVGSSRKKNFTVLGDAVNLASRLEGANKMLDTAILIGPQTARAVEGKILTRPVALLRVKGKTEAVEVYEPLAATVSAEETTRRFSELSHTGFRAYLSADFPRAESAYAKAALLRPNDAVTLRCLHQARTLAAEGVPTGWQPTLILETK
ncbi:MAG TPA: adenylate/guanylate cyclase domain-containing protein [Opitutaceae bacterium]|nr:adenylate/guanylate cyclase domain-containing protein [Opitutaceae bacterium]